MPYTETFIRDQIRAIPDWEIVKVGFSNVEGGIDHADFAPYSTRVTDLVVRSVLGVHPYLNAYKKVLQDAGAMLLHAHFGPGGIEALPLSRAAGLPLLTTFHGADAALSRSRSPWARSRYPRNLSELFRHSAKLIAVSSHIADALLKNGAPAKKIEVLHTGTKIIPLRDSDDRQGIVFVGRLIDIKGPMELLRAMSLTDKEIRHSTPITIVGDGPLRGALETFARDRHLTVKFTGKVDSGLIPALLRSHSVFCGPSLPAKDGTREGFGMVFIEAALQELACVGYASGGVMEAVEHGTTGLLAPEGDIQTLSEYLVRLTRDEEFSANLGRNGRVRAKAMFNLDVQAENLAAIYQEVAN
ncbi:glycosyltransferase [Arthrobacter methylotrophus]|uniref:Glycosyltransferase n=1 Tax=Arthrobacter methylotrophus TaxID=121291 RepID=A0ABV5USS4_9MICC